MLKSNSSKLQKIVIVTIVCVPLFLGFSRYAIAATPIQAVAEGYSSNTILQPGMIVKLDNKNSTTVDPLTLSDVSKMLGVVVSSTAATITLGNNNAVNQVYITNYGRHDVLVSNQNGPIKVGDYITISNVSGIGMKADGSESLVLGQAAGNFNGKANVAGTTNLIESNGLKKNVAFGLVPVDISIASNPLVLGPKGLPTFLKKVTSFATNKSVSAIRVYLSMFIVLVGVILSITVIYAGVKNGLISLGRNPLARRTISGSLIRIVIAGIIIFGISLGAAYAILI